jgi:hypothetical protein
MKADCQHLGHHQIQKTARSVLAQEQVEMAEDLRPEEA